MEIVGADRKQEFHEKFERSTLAFEAKCGEMRHRECYICQVVSMQDIFAQVKGRDVCKNCARGKEWSTSFASMLPVWIDDHKKEQYYVPEVLSCLREGEKLLIQRISVFVPLHHLMYGQLGARGHIVSFPQDISDVCSVLPRLPEEVNLIRVVKHFNLEPGDIQSKTFLIRKQKVLDALHWLRKFNVVYRDIEIDETKLSWIDGEEAQLPPSRTETIVRTESLSPQHEDRGPAEEQVATVTDDDAEIEPCYGTVRNFNEHVPKEKDRPIIESILAAQEIGMSKCSAEKRPTINFPYVSAAPVCEWSERHLFEKAFPCLFPGGTGGFGSIIGEKPSLREWLVKTMLYKDARFARDKMWAFCALNFLARHQNQDSGSFFVQTFFKKGPKSLEELKEQVENGNLSWLNSICYFSQKVTGSAAYWRARRNEVFTWINYHLEQGHGPPTFFITLSCAEYHWKDIERLIKDRCEKGGLKMPDFTKGRVALINEHSIVVQEYFQKRVNAWLETVGKNLLGIKYYWLRYEFAPSRGQIHTHMLAISENTEVMQKCHDLRDKKEELAAYLSSWMEDTLGMTATCNNDLIDDIQRSSNIPHPSTLNYQDILPEKADEDITNCQLKFQKHKCSDYCMRKRKHTKKDEKGDVKLRRACRCGAGIEEHYKKCNTPGFKMRTQAALVRDLRGFDRIDLPRNHDRITQCSTFIVRGWRANCDIQPLLYKSSPKELDASDVSRVTNYIVAYAAKGCEAVVEEKKAISSIIRAANEEDGNVKDVKRVARRVLNEAMKNRVVSKQEAICQLAGLPLWQCSELFENVSLSGNTKLGTEFQGQTTFLSRYAKRNAMYHHMSLHQYFHFFYNQKPSNNNGVKKYKIPVYSGAKCEAVFPATPEYARGVLMIHCPWHGSFDNVDDDTLRLEFEKFITNETQCPLSVRVSYHRAMLLQQMKEPTTTANDIDYDSYSVKPDQDHADLVDLASTIYKIFDDDIDSLEMKYDYGKDYDWSKRTIEIDMSNEQISKLLANSLGILDDIHTVTIPYRSNGTRYKVEDLAIDQKEALAEVLQALREYCTGRYVNKERVERITVCGVAGSGKSTWINTLVSCVRNIFQDDDTICVFAPTGAAAYNAGGQTIHGGFLVPTHDKDGLNISPNKNKYLLKRYAKTMVIIIDERSMVDSHILGTVQHYMQQCAHGGHKADHPWGGIPIIVLVGDDYQLPPIRPGAFYALTHQYLQKDRMTPSDYLNSKGMQEFREIGKKVVYLDGEKRVNTGQDVFKRMLRAVRCEDSTEKMLDEDMERLLQLHLSHPKYSDSERKQIQEEALYVFANKEPRDKLNSMKLKDANTKDSPVARIRSKTQKPSGRLVSADRHFDEERYPKQVLICKGARVTLHGCNPDPKHGLYHGSLGIVRDIVYEEGQSPSTGDFPAYVLVEFYQYCGETLIENMPRCVPITAHTVRCTHQCCTRTFIPLVLAYGKTAHTFQGQTVGPTPKDRPPNAIQKIIVDPGKREFEGKHCGLFYQLLSRSTTIGNPNDNLSSGIYFDGDNFKQKRIENLTMKNKREMYKMASLRQMWVSYLKDHQVSKGQWTTEKMDELFEWVSNTKILESHLSKIVETMK